MYKSSAWKKKRAAILRRDHYKSQLAARYGKNLSGDTVHHMLPVEFFPEYRLKDWNLITVTHDEHNRLHDRETHRLTAEGLALARRAALKAGLDVAEVMRKLEGDDEEEDEGRTDQGR